ncbi:uncharacterized protein LOC123532615 [Mercenaria mercenaria]|uniref:uncharacterized protein LOC123532615 n=1 Tax=Mercenaria mercenaria TaxID=6596 RepID=UPI001E1E1BB9|nr:uncharacterized protein LOC123532615 [Mercenaria mercenaria]XP_045170021.1 uncharacterized protein LOC123532615 [Mercenaria mercenaria]
MDDHIRKLNDNLISLIRAGNKAQYDLYTTSRVAEDSVRAFQTEQKERIDELAEKSITEIRDITEGRREAINKVLLELTGHLKVLSDGIYKDSNICQAREYVDSLNNDAFLQDNTVCFEGNLDLAESLLSASRLGRCHLNSDDTLLGKCSNIAIETEEKTYFMPFWYQTGCRVAGEHSWTTSSLPSISDNNYYDTVSVSESHLTLTSCKESFKRPKTEDKILNEPEEHTVFRYFGQFETYKHRTPCVIPDITLLNDMKLVLIDHYHNSIQLFSKDFFQLDEKSCPYPMGLCRLSNNCIAVTLRRTGQIAIFQVQKTKLQQKRTIRVQCDSYLWQVTYKLSQLFVVCDENDIHVLDTNGHEYCVIRSGVSSEHGYLRYFDVNDKDHHIYLSERRGLRCIDFIGKLQWLFTNDDFPVQDRDKQGHAIEDVCYHNGKILGARWTLSKIFQISTDGKFLRNIITDHLEHPRVMSVLGNRLVVTQFYPVMKPVDRRTVKVFEMDSYDYLC